MTINGVEKEIDSGNRTSPVVINNRTLLPVRTVIEGIGGSIDWNEEKQEVTLVYGQDTIRLTIGSDTAYLNNTVQMLDTAPTIINGRTMLPIRFISESFNFDVDWNGETQTVTITEESKPTVESAVENTISSFNETMLKVTFGNDGSSYNIALEDNATTQFLVKYLGSESMNLPIYHDGDYEGYEYYDIPSKYKIPAEPKPMTSASAGEVYYADNQILLFYEDEDISGDYVKIGTITDTTDLKEAVEKNPVLKGWGNKIISIEAVNGN
jgi:hypothetical protein